jgi:hypothetical protein
MSGLWLDVRTLQMSDCAGRYLPVSVVMREMFALARR